MSRSKISYDTIARLLCRYIANEEVSDIEKSQLRKWLSLSNYNQSILDDIDADEKLRSKLLAAYYTDITQFWYILLTYRTSLHPFMPAPTGNFWERMVRPVTHLFK